MIYNIHVGIALTTLQTSVSYVSQTIYSWFRETFRKLFHPSNQVVFPASCLDRPPLRLLLLKNEKISIHFRNSSGLALNKYTNWQLSLASTPSTYAAVRDSEAIRGRFGSEWRKRPPTNPKLLPATEGTVKQLTIVRRLHRRFGPMIPNNFWASFTWSRSK